MERLRYTRACLQTLLALELWNEELRPISNRGACWIGIHRVPGGVRHRLRHRLLVGRASSHGGHVAGAGDRRLAGRGRGRLFLAIYNDRGAKFRFWCRIKRLYLSGTPGRTFAWALFIPYFVFGVLATDLLRGRTPVVRYVEYKRPRAMSMIHDWRDWLGGYPFEVAKS